MLVIPTRTEAKRLADLTPPELGALMSSVQRVGSVIERAYGANALTVACQVSTWMCRKAGGVGQVLCEPFNSVFCANQAPAGLFVRYRSLLMETCRHTQDGREAGQSIPHVHFHIMPRGGAGDRFAGPRNDEIYPKLEENEQGLPEAFGRLRAQGAAQTAAGVATSEAFQPIKMDAEEERRPRTMEDMEREAAWLKTFFESE